MEKLTDYDPRTFDAGELIKQQSASKSNLCTEIELKEQARIAQNAFVEADNGDGEVNFDELKKICEKLGIDLGKDEEEAMIKIDKDGTGIGHSRVAHLVVEEDWNESQSRKANGGAG